MTTAERVETILDRPAIPAPEFDAYLLAEQRAANLPRQLVVEVTPEDIRTGVPNSANHCPIANAFRRKLTELGMPPVTLNVEIFRAEVCTGSVGPWVAYWHDSQRFVQDFDSGQVVAPRFVVLSRLHS